MWNVWTRLAEWKGEGGGADGPWSQCVPPRWLAGEERAWGRVSVGCKMLLALSSPCWVGCYGGEESSGPAVGFTAGSCRRREG